MYKLVSKLVIYRNIGKDSILFRMADICRDFDSGNYEPAHLTDRILDEIHDLMDVSTAYGFDRNLWQNYLAYLIAMTENPFTLVSEKNGSVEGTVNDFAMNDFAIFKQLFDYDFTEMEQALGLNCFRLITNYRSVPKKEQFFNRNVSVRVCRLSEDIDRAETVEEMYDIVMEFYRHYGVGKFGMNRAFRIAVQDGRPEIVPITATGGVVLGDLVGYERQKKQLTDNTEAFLSEQPANNVLLYGDAGTGKSTSIKALLNHYYDRGLRMIEVYKHDFKYLPEIISIIKSRNYRFVIYMDDLSFESAETEYKYLKAVIEGDLEVRPDNVLIYATSNRRHLIRESFADRQETDANDVHKNDTMAEKLSLSARFGVSIAYYKPAHQEYHDIVRTLAERQGVNLPEEELLLEADCWATRHGGESGRVAQQFVDMLAGKNKPERA